MCGYEYRCKPEFLTTEYTDEHGNCHLAKIRGNVGEKRRSRRFLKFA